MNKHWKIILTAALFIPFFFRLNNMFEAWQYSPLDQKDYIFWIIALTSVLVIFLWKYPKPDFKPKKNLDYYGLLLLFAGVALLAYASMKDINTVFLAGSLLFVAGGCWLLWGWRIFWMLMPVFFIAGLGLPSTSYWTSFLFRNCIQNFSGFSIKLGFAIIATGWLLLCLRFPRKIFISPEPFFFCTALTVFSIGYIQTAAPEQCGIPVHLKIVAESNKWLGENMPLSRLDASFRGENIAKRYVHYSKTNIKVGTLTVKLRNDLHQIHPAALCLATARWKIHSTTRELPKTRLGTLSVTKIIAERNEQRVMFFSWYTNDFFSTGSFIYFRKSWHFDETWYIYQIATPIISSEEQAEKTLLDFINIFATLELH